MGVKWVERDKLDRMAKEKVIKVHTVLDIGSGIRPQSFFRPKVHICVEPYLPYLESLQSKVANDPRYIFINCTWDAAMKNMLPKSVDTVFAIDFIEHLDKDEGYAFLRESERVARRQIVLMTPLGLYPQTYDDPNKPDRWGMHGGFWQTHRCGWHVEDFDDNWELLCCKDRHLIDENDQPLEEPIGAIWAFRNFNEPSSLTMNSWLHFWRILSDKFKSR
jgi:hypothetical protein